jgi:hypothetical protein
MQIFLSRKAFYLLPGVPHNSLPSPKALSLFMQARDKNRQKTYHNKRGAIIVKQLRKIAT